MKFKILGTLEIVDDEKAYRPSSPKVCQVLALLLGNANQVVSNEVIIDELWGEHPPRSVAATVQTYIYQLRRALSSEFADSAVANSLVTQAPGYRLNIRPEEVDANVFETLVTEGRALSVRGRTSEARDLFERALALWEGDALANVPQERRLGSLAVRLEERRIEALKMKITAEMRLGMHAELISELRTCTDCYPLNEWFVAQLMCALIRSGRRGEALLAFQRLRETLVRELALEPSSDLRRLQMTVLGGDVDADGALPGEADSGASVEDGARGPAGVLRSIA